MYDKIEIYQHGVAIQVFRDVESYKFTTELLQQFHLEVVLKDKTGSKKRAAVALGSGTTVVFLESDYAGKNGRT